MSTLIWKFFYIFPELVLKRVLQDSGLLVYLIVLYDF